MAADFGDEIQVAVWSDAPAAIAIAQRGGLGKLRHIQTQYLWIQERVAAKDIGLKKVLGTNNPADLFTKHLDEKTNLRHTVNLGYKIVDGRPEDAPQLHIISISLDDYQTSGNHQAWPWLQYLQRRKGFDNNKSTKKVCGGGLDVVTRSGAGIVNEDENAITIQTGM